MMTSMIITAIAVSLLSLASVVYAVKSAVVGYEDENGFHQGNESQQLRTAAVATESQARFGGMAVHS